MALKVTNVLSAAFAIVLAALLVPLAGAQDPVVPPVYPAIDGNGVDIITGDVVFSSPPVSIGGTGGLSYTQVMGYRGWSDNVSGEISQFSSGGSSFYSITIGGATETFEYVSGDWISVQRSGGSLEVNGSTNTYTYTTGDGTEIIFDDDHVGADPYRDDGILALVESIETPSGERTDYHYRSTTITYNSFTQPPLGDDPPGGWGSTATATVWRLQSITNNRGYQLYFVYGNSATSHDLTDFTDLINYGQWTELDAVRGVNNAYEYCDPTSGSCTNSTHDWPELRFDYSVTDERGYTLYGDANLELETRVSWGSYFRIEGIEGPGASMDDVTYTYCTSTQVNNGECYSIYSVYEARLTGGTSSTSDDIVTTYRANAPSGYSVGSGNFVRRVEAPNSAETVLEYNSANQIVKMTNAAGAVTEYVYNSAGLVEEVIVPTSSATAGSDSNRYWYEYDLRGNLTRVGVSDGVLVCGSPCEYGNEAVFTAVYPESTNTVCSNPIICNRPTSTTIPGQGTTNYTWSTTHGGMLTATPPRPATGADQPRTTITYSTYQARYILTSGGSVTGSGDPIYLPYHISTCLTGHLGSCSSANERLVYLAYGMQSGAFENNLAQNIHRVSDGAVTSTSTVQYNSFFNKYGDVYTVDGSLSGNVDYVEFYYDALRRPTGQIGVDPDGAGGLLRRASRTEYDSRGRAYLAESGTVAGLGQSNLNGMTVFASAQTVFDAFNRPVRQSTFQTSGSVETVTSLTETSYYNHGSPECVARRMDISGFTSWNSAPSISACVRDDTSDEITRRTYDAHGRVASITTGYVTDPETIEFDYFDTGQISLITDAQDREIAYLYTYRNQLLSIGLPDPSDGEIDGTSATITDARTYNTLGQITAYQDYNGNSFTYSYDDLGRRTHVNAPGTAYDVTLTYNNIGDLLTATQGTGGTSMAVTYTYDALSRPLTQASPLSRLSYTYDTLGRRASMSWNYTSGSGYTAPTSPPSSMSVEYDYLNTGEIEEIREDVGGSEFVLANYIYDSNGRLTQIDRPGSVPDTTYTYDARSMLDTMTHGSTSIQRYSFDYDYAGRIISRTRSNGSWAFSGYSASNDEDNCFDGRNRYEGTPTSPPSTASSCNSVSSPSASYDANGNLTDAVNGRDYIYDFHNRLSATENGSGTEDENYAHDALGRLYSIDTSGSAARLLEHDGQNIIGDYSDDENVTSRYVNGPGVDNPLVRYTSDTPSSSTRRWVLSDERGSIVAEYNASGTMVAGPYSYDEYGQQGLSNDGLLGFAGRPWLPQSGVYDNRARVYHPGIGRFLQRDPIGQAGGLNIYNYTGSDPVNFTDPTGMYSNGCFHHDREVCAAQGYLEPIEYWANGGPDGLPSFRPNLITLSLFGRAATYLGGWANVARLLDSGRLKPVHISSIDRHLARCDRRGRLLLAARGTQYAANWGLVTGAAAAGLGGAIVAASPPAPQTKAAGAAFGGGLLIGGGLLSYASGGLWVAAETYVVLDQILGEEC
jgi:RHS repeat-associated protein